MAVRYYDKALLEKIKKWVKDPNMTISGPDETRRLFEYTADVTNDSAIKLPLIALRRGRDLGILSTNKKPLTFDATTLAANQKKSIQLNAVPIRIDYQLDIYTRYFEEADEYVRNFVFNFINFPKVQIEIPYEDVNLVHDATVRISDTVTDNSDIPERLMPGQFTRFTFSLEIDDAYLFSTPIRDNLSVEYETEIKLKENN